MRSLRLVCAVLQIPKMSPVGILVHVIYAKLLRHAPAQATSYWRHRSGSGAKLRCRAPTLFLETISSTYRVTGPHPSGTTSRIRQRY